LENLLLNAHEAGADQGTVTLSEGRSGSGMATIAVADNGPGIAEDLLPEAIFEPFKTTKPKGSGIGLWQVKRLTAALGGSIAAVNGASAKGAQFTISLPKSGSAV
jgi:signal transduction histidine kinase